MNTLKNIARNLFRALRWIWTLISYIPTFFIRTLTVLIIILIIFNYFSKFTTNIKDGTALLIQMDGILVEQAKSKSSFDFFIQNNDPKEIEINKCYYNNITNTSFKNVCIKNNDTTEYVLSIIIILLIVNYLLFTH